MNTSASFRAVSPVVGVILVVAITVALSGVVGVFVFDLGQSVSNSQTSGDIGTRTTYNDDGTVTVQVVTGEAEELRILVDGTEAPETISNPSPGDSVTVTATKSQSITIISQTNGQSTVVTASSAETSGTTTVTVSTDFSSSLDSSTWIVNDGDYNAGTDSADGYVDTANSRFHVPSGADRYGTVKYNGSATKQITVSGNKTIGTTGDGQNRIYFYGEDKDNAYAVGWNRYQGEMKIFRVEAGTVTVLKSTSYTHQSTWSFTVTADADSGTIEATSDMASLSYSGTITPMGDEVVMFSNVGGGSSDDYHDTDDLTMKIEE